MVIQGAGCPDKTQKVFDMPTQTSRRKLKNKIAKIKTGYPKT